MSQEVEEVRQLPAILKPIERSSVVLAPVMDLTTAKVRLREFQEFVEGYLQESKDGGQDGGDYGIIPGTKKKTLLKSGADKLCELYGLADRYDIKATIDWEKGLFDYEITCTLTSRRDDSVVGTGVGSCSSFESKYRWRDQQRKCPNCGKENIRKSNKGDGWYCWVKTNGCGTTFKNGDASIETQVTGRVENPDIIDMKNTVLKIAKKRAKIDAVIGVTRSSGIFAQDLEEIMPPNQPPVKEIEVTAKEVVLGTPLQPVTTDIRVPLSPSVPEESALERKLRESLESIGATKEQPRSLAELKPEHLAQIGKPADTNGYISLDDLRAIHIHAKSFVSKKHEKFARTWVHDFLVTKGVVDENGEGTLTKLKKFYVKDGQQLSNINRVREALEPNMKQRDADKLAEETQA